MVLKSCTWYGSINTVHCARFRMIWLGNIFWANTTSRPVNLRCFLIEYSILHKALKLNGILLILVVYIVSYNSSCMCADANTCFVILSTSVVQVNFITATDRISLADWLDGWWNMTNGQSSNGLMYGHQGWNFRHGLCHIYMIYVYIYISCL